MTLGIRCNSCTYESIAVLWSIWLCLVRYLRGRSCLLHCPCLRWEKERWVNHWMLRQLVLKPVLLGHSIASSCLPLLPLFAFCIYFPASLTILRAQEVKGKRRARDSPLCLVSMFMLKHARQACWMQLRSEVLLAVRLFGVRMDSSVSQCIEWLTFLLSRFELLSFLHSFVMFWMSELEVVECASVNLDFSEAPVAASRTLVDRNLEVMPWSSSFWYHLFTSPTPS